MGQFADRVYVDAADVRRLETLVAELAVNARVSLQLFNGDTTEGIVAVTPTVQVFRDPQGQEGMNGVVKLIDPKRGDWDELVWLGNIKELRHLDSVTRGASKA